MRSLVKIVSILLFGLFLIIPNSRAAPIPLDIKRIVAFIYYPTNTTNAAADGTGFLVGVVSKNTNKTFSYLVTAKHVVRPTTNSWLPLIFARVNCLDGSSQMIPIRLVTTGRDKNVFIHDDPSVDIAIIPFLPDPKRFDFKLMSIDFITTDSDFKDLDIHEGSDVFFTGMFVQHLGEMRNTPITRFGKVALITDEKIDWVFGKTDMYLMEVYVYGGYSGSPVFFQIGAERHGMVTFGGPNIKLAGVVSGHYNDIQPIETVSVSTNQYVTANLGICGIVPSYKIRDVLLSKELQHQRGD